MNDEDKAIPPVCLYNEAKKYHSFGLSVIPVNSAKEALIKGWTKNRIPPNGQFNDANGIGLVCGKFSGGVEVVDVDCKYDLTGTLFEDLTRLIEESAPSIVSRLTVQKTRSDGYHLIYRCNTIEGNQKLANREATDNEKKEGEKIHPLIETRGEGGYICIAPTPGYSIIQGDLSNIPVITADERNILLSSARQFQQVYKKSNEPSYKGGGKSPFQIYNDRGSPIELLRAHGWQIVKTKDSEIYLKRPGITQSKWSAVYRIERKCFYVFSTSTEFDTDKAYSPAAIFCKLEVGDDWKKCASLLLEKGFGHLSSGKTLVAKQPGHVLTAENIYIQFPLFLMRDFFSDTRQTINKMMCYGYCRFCEKTGLELSQFVARNSEEVRKIANDVEQLIEKGEPMPMINIKHLLDYIGRDKSEKEKAQLAAYIAIRSIIGKRQYCKTNKLHIIARMFGYASYKIIPELITQATKELMTKYSNRYHYEKTLQELELNWHVVTYGYHVHGLYVGVNVSLDTLSLAAETRKRKNKLAKLKLEKSDARNKATTIIQQQLNKDEQLNKAAEIILWIFFFKTFITNFF